MKDEGHRSEADVLESVDRKDYRRRSAPTDPLKAWGELLSFTTFCSKDPTCFFSVFGLRN